MPALTGTGFLLHSLVAATSLFFGFRSREGIGSGPLLEVAQATREYFTAPGGDNCRCPECSTPEPCPVCPGLQGLLWSAAVRHQHALLCFGVPVIILVGCLLKLCCRTVVEYGDERGRVLEELAAAGAPARQVFRRPNRALAAFAAL